MTKAKITAKTGYRCCPNGHTVELYPCGTIVEGQVAKWAISESAAKAMFPASKNPAVENKATKPRENKRKRVRK